MNASLQTIGVTGLGMVSPLGHDAFASCAAARAGLDASAELEVLDVANEGSFGEEEDESEIAVFGHGVPGVAEGFSGFGKAIALGVPALADLLAKRPLSGWELSRTAIFVNLTDRAVEEACEAASPSASEAEDVEELGSPSQPLSPSAAWRERSASLIPRMLRDLNLLLPEKHQRLFHGGRAGIALAVREAVAEIWRGSVDRCIVGGIDSRIEPGFLRAAVSLGLLRTNENPVGLIPGEAASFFLLERAEEAAASGVSVRALVVGASATRDARSHFDEAPPLGRGLAEAISSVLAEPRLRPPGWFVGDLNGTQRSALDWGHALSRLRAEHAFDTVPSLLPAASFGDTGAAAGAIAISLVARAFERGYAPGRSAIVWLASESGARGAVGLLPHRG